MGSFSEELRKNAAKSPTDLTPGERNLADGDAQGDR